MSDTVSLKHKKRESDFMTHQITLIGKDITSVYHAIKEFGPDCVHLLYTDETEDVLEPMYGLLPQSILRYTYLVKPYDARSVVEVCREIHRTFQGEFTYHLSEGTKLMAFAANVVAMEEKAKAYYLTQQGEAIVLSDFEKISLKTSLSNEEIIQLSGNILSGYHDCKDLTDEDIDMAWKIKKFIENFQHEHARIQRYFSLYCGRHLDRLPSVHLFPDRLSFKQKDGGLLVSSKNKIVLKLDYKNGCHLYFEGRWWETLVAERVRDWSESKANSPEVWQSVLFQLETGKSARTKNEVDVLLNNEQQLIFIECKSGQVTQEDIYKIDAVRETYGGDISQAVLASYYPVESDLREKCKDLQINVFAPSSFAGRINFVDTLPRWLDGLDRKIII